MTRSAPDPLEPAGSMSIPETVSAAGGAHQDITAPKANEPEKIYYEGSPLVRGNLAQLFLFFLVGVLFVAAPFIYRWTQYAWWSWWVVLLCVAIGLLFIAGPIFWSKTVRYRISNYRIDFERGLLSKNIDTMELWHVDDLKFHQSLFDRMMGVGTITIFATDQSTPTLPLRGIPKPREIFDNLKARVIAIKRSRGVIKMDAG